MNITRTAPSDAPFQGDYQVVVIGAGPAGSITALRLMKTLAGVGGGGARPRVLIVDREDFPRSKVCGCCLNGAAVGALEMAGLADLPEELNAIRLTRWQAHVASSKPFARPKQTSGLQTRGLQTRGLQTRGLQTRGRGIVVPLPSGWAVSREALDAALLDHARSAGAAVRTGVVARVLGASEADVRVELKTAAGVVTVRAAVVVVASGLSGGGIEAVLPWRRPPAGPIGLGATLVAPENEFENEYVPGTIYMACDRTGYAGLVRLEDGRLDIAAAVYDPAGEGRRRGAGERVAAILKSAGMPPVPGIEAAMWRGTPRLHRQRQPGNGRVIAVGDAAGYVEPFTGEGMAWGMQSGLLAARVIAEVLAGNRATAAEQLGVRYTRQYDRLLARRRLPCRILTAALRSTWKRRMLFQTLSVAPWLAGPVVRMLNRPG